MLRELSIKNFAIIDDMQISFSHGLTILSGETGAGKTIIIQAVNLLLGTRASTKLIRTGAEYAELEALFELSQDHNQNIINRIRQHGYDISDGLVIRRIISRTNRHKTYINGSLATINVLNAVTQNLASISGQHAHQGLLKEDQHLLILDTYGALLSLRKKVSDAYSKILPLISRLKQFRKKQTRQTEHIALLEFQKNEIISAAIAPDEDLQLEQEQTRLKNAGALYKAAYNGIEQLYNSEGAVTEQLVRVQKDLEAASEIDSELDPVARETEQAVIKIEDISEQLRTYAGNIRIDEQRLLAVEERLYELGKLKHKYGGTLEAVNSRLQAINRELSDVQNLSEKTESAQAELGAQHETLVRLSNDLSAKRVETADRFSKKVEKELETLKMSKTRFKIALQPIQNENTDPHLITEGKPINETGIDTAQFQIAPNVGEDLKPLANTASGGELSRVVLALKAILARTEELGTVVFDEVDAGIGGSVAELVGKKISNLSQRHQIICITHLPQIAKFGDHHFRISKHVSHGRTRTIITHINQTGRIKEIARMLGGENITRAALDHAKELMDR
jgi:DNA repair protein RecN (Recombination protein N)